MSKKLPTKIWKFAADGSAAIDPTTVPQRSGTFAAAAVNEGTTVLLTVHDANGLHSYFLAPDTAGSQVAANHLANTVSATAKEIDGLPLNLDNSDYVGRLEYKHGSSVARDGMVGTNPTETARLLASSLPLDSWVAIVVRKPTESEKKHSRRWFSHRLGAMLPQHHSIAQSSVVMSVWAGSGSKSDTRQSLSQVASILPGFDLVTREVMASKLGVGPALVAASVVLFAAVIVGVPYLAAEVRWDYYAQVSAALYGVAASAGLAGILRLMGTGPNKYKSLRIGLDSNRFPSPEKRFGSPSAPRDARTQGDRQIKATDGSYPLASSSFLVGPQVIVGLVAPHAGVVSGAVSSSARAVPMPMRKAIGPLIGYDSLGNPAHLNADDLQLGTAIVGQSESGKSNLLRAMYGWAMADRLMPSGRPGFPGARNTMIAIESKGDGADGYAAWADTAMELAKETVIDAQDPKWQKKRATWRINVTDMSTPAINFFPKGGSLEQRATAFVDAMQYTYGTESIGVESHMNLVRLFTAALAVTPQLVQGVPDVLPNKSPLYYTYVLVGGWGDQRGVDLATKIISESDRLVAAGTPDAGLIEAANELRANYVGTTPAQRKQAFKAPVSKIKPLLAMDVFFDPARPKMSWKDIIVNHGSVIINTGPSTPRHGATAAEDAANEALSDSGADRLSGMLMYTLKKAIVANCSSFQAEGRYVSIYNDELSMLGAASSEVITWMKDKGRSFGVRPMLATQRPDQLEPSLRTNFLTFNALISFSQQNRNAASEVAEALGGSGADLSAEDVLNLPQYHAAVRTSIRLQRQAACIVHAHNFEADRRQSLALQGFGPEAVDSSGGVSKSEIEMEMWK